MQWQIATWKEALNENFVLQKGQKQSNQNGKGTIFILKPYSFFICSIFNKSFVSSSLPFRYLELSWASPQLLQIPLPLGKVWLWAAGALTGSTAPAPRECRRRRRRQILAKPPNTTVQGGDRPGSVPPTSLGWVLKVALSLDLEFLFCRFLAQNHRRWRVWMKSKNMKSCTFYGSFANFFVTSQFFIYGD